MAFLHMALSKTQYNKIVKQSLKKYDKQAANGFWKIKHHNWVKYCMHGNIIIIIIMTQAAQPVPRHILLLQFLQLLHINQF